MRFELRAQGIKMSRELRSAVNRRIHFAFARMANQIERVTVHLWRPDGCDEPRPCNAESLF